MNDTEIDLMSKLLAMDPYQRITARMAIEHDWFDALRAKDPDYAGDDSSVDVTTTCRRKQQMFGNKESA